MPQYGTFEMPELLAYPEIKEIGDVPELFGIFAYIVSDYRPGYSCLVKRNGGEAGILIGDWNGNKYVSKDILKDKVPILINIMINIDLQQAQFYFDSNDTLVDVQIHANKFIGPGMLRDLFSNSLKTQEVLSIDTINDDIIKKLHGSIAKPSRFRTIEEITPMYARI